MKWSWFGRAAMALMSAVALGLSMTACGGGTIAYLWTIGSQYNQIASFKVDDYTGNLTQIPHSPFSVQGTTPVDIVVKPGGRYVYVINQGTGSTATSNAADAGIAEFSVGGDGTLTYQQSFTTQGYTHLWAAFDSTGTYLSVLDKYSASGNGNGAITTFSSDATNGVLHLVTQTASTQPGQPAPTYLEVGQNPLMMVSTGSCLFTVNQPTTKQPNTSVTAYSIATGQLSVVTTGNYVPSDPTGLTPTITSITGNTQYVFMTDTNTTSTATGGYVLPYTIGSGCTLTPFTGGAVANNVNARTPSYTFIDSASKYVYVLNQSTTSTSTNSVYSSITAYAIVAGQLQELSGSPFKSGSGPVCMVEDPTSKWMYVSNFNDGTITGYAFSATQGTLQDLSRGSTFNATGRLGCLAISGAVS
jgi:6-phosphogluconolactonase (cycloisomerase 2 family)